MKGRAVFVFLNKHNWYTIDTAKQMVEPQIKIRDDKGAVTMESRGIKGITRDYYKKLYANILENLKVLVRFLDAYNLPKRSHRHRKSEQVNKHDEDWNMNEDPLNKGKPRTGLLHCWILLNFKIYFQFL